MGSKRAANRRGCQGKKRYPTKAEAGVIAGAMGGKARRLHAYRCPRCGLYHVGHMPHRRRRKRRADFQ